MSSATVDCKRARTRSMSRRCATKWWCCADADTNLWCPTKKNEPLDERLSILTRGDGRFVVVLGSFCPTTAVCLRHGL